MHQKSVLDLKQTINLSREGRGSYSCGMKIDRYPSVQLASILSDTGRRTRTFPDGKAECGQRSIWKDC